MKRKSFFDFALLDYTVAKNNPIDPFYFDSTVCLLTQCIEKLLKGFIQRNLNETPLRTHKLVTLSRQLCVIEDFRFLKDEASNLSILQDSYFDRRYPSDDYYVLDMEDFENLTNNAYRIIDKLVERLPADIQFKIPNSNSNTCRRMEF